MIVKKLILENFRGFEKIEIDFDKNLNVFIGKNGSGKSSVLDAIANNLEYITKSVDKESVNQKFNFWPNSTDLKKSQSQGFIRLIVEDNNQDFEQSMYLNKSQSKPWNSSSIQNISEYINKFIKNKSKSLPVFLHIRSTRNKDEQNEIVYKYESRLECYNNAFSFFNAHFNEFTKWFENLENHENAERLKPGNLNFRLSQLKLVRLAISTFFENLENIEISEPSINREEKISNEFKQIKGGPQLIIKKGNVFFNLDQLSDGEQYLITIVADIARRACLAALEDGLNASGVVLIDEIEIHLHPRWQRKVLPALINTFPNIQFITSTHSPQVLSGVKAESIILLKDFKQYSIHSTLGKDTNSILAEMEVDEGPYSDQINELYMLIKDKNVDAAKKLQKDLESTIGSDYGHLIKSRLFLERMM